MEYANRIMQHSYTIIGHDLATNIGECKHYLLEVELFTKTKIQNYKIEKRLEKLYKTKYEENFNNILQTSIPIDTFETLIKLIQETKNKATKMIGMNIREINGWITLY